MSERDLDVVSALTRRGFLTKTAAVGGALAAGNLLAACGGGSGGGGGGSTAAATAPTGEALGEELREILGAQSNLMKEGPGNFNIVGSFPLTGPGSIYGKLQSEGFRFGAEAVSAWTDGKLNFKLEAVDNAGGDPQKSVANARKAGLAGDPIFLTSYIFGFGTQPAIIDQYEMLTLDPGGGTGPLAKGLPYCYGFKTAFPVDLIKGLMKTIQELNPDVKTFSVIDAEVNAEFNGANKEAAEGFAKELGGEVISYDTAELGATDYSAVVSKVKEAGADSIITLSFGTDPGYQARELQRQGVTVPLGGVDFTPDGTQIAGPAYKGWVFSDDFLDVEDPPSDWSKLFVKTWEAEKGSPPENYNAAYYVSAFAYAIMMDRILGFGGDIQSGKDWLKALEMDTTFPHVYGGAGSDIGKIVLNKKTHSPDQITCIGFESEGTGNTQGIVPLATYGIDASEYKFLG